jgi:hypothetical protein
MGKLKKTCIGESPFCVLKYWIISKLKDILKMIELEEIIFTICLQRLIWFPHEAIGKRLMILSD